MALCAVLAAVAATVAMFAVFVDAGVIAVAMAAVMYDIKGCMMTANAAVDSSTAGYASASKSSASG